MKNGKSSKSRVDPLDDEVDIHTLRYLETGKYFKQKAAEHRFVQLDEDVYAEFPTPREVNCALRELIKFRKAIVNLTAARTQRKRTA